MSDNYPVPPANTLRLAGSISSTAPDATPSGQAIVSPQNITLAISAILTVLGYIFHTDLSNLAGPVGTLATAIIGAAIAIESAVKYRANTVVQIRADERDLARELDYSARSAAKTDNVPAIDVMADYFTTLDQRIDDKITAAVKDIRAPKTRAGR